LTSVGGDPPPSAMPLTGHLTELRNRLIKSLIAVAIAAGIAFYFGNNLVEVLLIPFPDDVTVTQLRVLEGVSVRMKVALWGGFVLAFPIVLYHVLKFALPALLPNEKKFFFVALPVFTGLFLGGVAFSFLLLIPLVMAFLPQILGDLVIPQISIESIVGTTVWLTISMGLVFELPVVMYLLARAGVLDPTRVARQRRVAILIAFVAAAVITPTGDPITMTVFGLPIWLLFEVGLVLARFATWRRRKKLAKSD
jgi:sec-independent protein translocase protein TatC